MATCKKCSMLVQDLKEATEQLRETLIDNTRLRKYCIERDDNLANYDNDMLKKFDPNAADSTDLSTWIKCLIAENIRLKREGQ